MAAAKTVRGGDVKQQQLVQAGTGVFYAEVEDTGGPQTVGLEDVLAFDGVRETIEAIAAELAGAWEQVKPDEASVEFGLALTAKSGKLTGLLVEGGGSASLKVALTWKAAGEG
jgi:hypothetical protein